ncbi:hypothetical protein OIU77_009317 [Salix suchowensis]|uniref:Uncharacterized protein n=1 Tax=Salix suchowensis TaxID=1278906 RepID=A0ABQ9ADW5_9ROSI|nr:hypothetical protein OIU77_009317 [Salix suchowensis]
MVWESKMNTALAFGEWRFHGQRSFHGDTFSGNADTFSRLYGLQLAPYSWGFFNNLISFFLLLNWCFPFY